MIYKKMQHPENRKLIKALAIAVMVSFAITISSCRTSYEGIYTAAEFDKLNSKEEHSIIEIETRDTVITKDDFHIFYIDTLSVFHVGIKETSFTLKPLPSKYEMFQKMSQLKLSDVYKIKTEYSEANTGATLLLIISSIIYIGGLIMFGIANIHYPSFY